MPTRLDDVLHRAEQNYILPFLWMHGETEAVIREEMARIHAAGIRAVCMEARPHPNFNGPRWWRDVDIIMDEARQRGMRVWLLDDDSFPTGHAAGRLIGAQPELRRVFLHEHHFDALGPQPGALLPLQPWLTWPQQVRIADASLVAAIAARRDPASDRLTGETIDLTDLVQDDMAYWDVPEGYWRIFTFTASAEGGISHAKDHLNTLVPASVRVLLDAVYEPFYERYAADFGQTFAGFFSDEPGFYNDTDMPYDYQATLGKRAAVLPWCAGLLDDLTAAHGSDFRRRLPLLWYDDGAATSATRYTYMDVLSRRYASSFTDQIGDWCRAHKVDYIGHVLEDNGNHARLGAGAGHFFRALGGQDMSGIDVVLWQLAPGFDQGPFAHIAFDADGEFYHYGLAKLGSSLGHLDPKKKGRTVAEVFGAYGWRTGLKLMKWLTDHMLVRGVNYFVPHAFSPAPFPDPDCPPHFYAHGENPQYRYYRVLNDYTNRLSHLLNGGQHVAALAVLYHAEAEWSGPAMPFERPVGALLRRQIDCDVAPIDSLLTDSRVTAGRLALNTETYAGLVVPWSEALPAAALSRLLALASAGLPLFFIDALPTRATEGQAVDVLQQLATHANVRVLPLAELADTVTALGYPEIFTDTPQPYLRNYHYQHEGLEIYMLFNEHPIQAVDTGLRLKASCPVGRYDALTNTLTPVVASEANGELTLNLQLSPYETALLVTGPAAQTMLAALPPAARLDPVTAQELAVSGPWTISTAGPQQYPAFTPFGASEGLADLARPGKLPRFSGTFRYETTFTVATAGGPAELDLGAAYEVAEVWVNGQPAGVNVAPPYRYNIGALLQPGVNTLTVEVTNTLVNTQPDFYSRYVTIEPSGLLGPVRLRWSPAAP